MWPKQKLSWFTVSCPTLLFSADPELSSFLFFFFLFHRSFFFHSIQNYIYITFKYNNNKKTIKILPYLSYFCSPWNLKPTYCLFWVVHCYRWFALTVQSIQKCNFFFKITPAFVLFLKLLDILDSDLRKEKPPVFTPVSVLIDDVILFPNLTWNQANQNTLKELYLLLKTQSVQR